MQVSPTQGKLPCRTAIFGQKYFAFMGIWLETVPLWHTADSPLILAFVQNRKQNKQIENNLPKLLFKSLQLMWYKKLQSLQLIGSWMKNNPCNFALGKWVLYLLV